MNQTYRDITHRKEEIKIIIKKMNTLGINLLNTPELKDLFVLFKKYIDEDIDVSGKIKCDTIGKNIHINLYRNTRAECSVILKTIT